MLAVSQNLMTTSSTPLISLALPAALSPRVINALTASPLSVDLRRQSPHFYRLATRILELFEEDDVVDVLLQVCVGVSS